MKPNLSVVLPKGRMSEGTLTATLASGETRTFRCLGRSDSSAAKSVGNPNRDPLKRFGDLPTGTYRATLIPPAPAEAARAYGPGVRWVLDGIAGDALQAKKNGRYGILIHGGSVGAPMPPNALRPTHGCLRVDNKTIDFLRDTMPESFLVQVAEQ